jgi:hypothetical protein
LSNIFLEYDSGIKQYGIVKKALHRRTDGSVWWGIGG